MPTTKSIFALVITATLCAACSMRPIPQDVTRHSTYQIAQRVRCEFRETLQDLIGRLLKRHGHEDIANSLSDKTLSYSVFFDKKVSGLSTEAKAVIERYRTGVIGYDFEFDISVDNNLSGGVGFLETLTLGQFALGVSGKDDRKRQDKRNFRLTDNFQGLVDSSVMERVCGPSTKLDIANKNPLYPIDGSLNLAETVESFVSLVQSGNLVGNPPDNIPTFADTITFTTTLSGTVNPKLTLTPVGAGLRLSSAEMSATKARTDVHKLIVALTLPTAGGPLTIAQRRAQSERAAVGELERQRVLAIDADTDTIRRSLLRR